MRRTTLLKKGLKGKTMDFGQKIDGAGGTLKWTYFGKSFCMSDANEYHPIKFQLKTWEIMGHPTLGPSTLQPYDGFQSDQSNCSSI